MPAEPNYTGGTTADHASDQVAQISLGPTSDYTPVNDDSSLDALADQFASTTITNVSSYGPALNNSQRAASPSRGKCRWFTGILQGLTKVDYEAINDGNRFFKVGRVFRCMWAEPAGSNARGYQFATPSSRGEGIYSKDRYFIVVKEQRGFCSCVSINTYGRQGTQKRGVNPDDHAAVYNSTKKPPPTNGERMTKKAFPIIVEAAGEAIDPMSRVNFARNYTVEHNVKVVKVGRIPPDDIPRLTKYFRESFLGEAESSAESAVPTASTNTYYSPASPANSVENTSNGYRGEYTTNPSWYVPVVASTNNGMQTFGANINPQPQPATPNQVYSTLPNSSANGYTPAYNPSQYSTDGYSTGPTYTGSYDGGQSTGYYSAQSPAWDQTPSQEDELETNLWATPAWASSTSRRDEGRYYDRTDRRRQR